MLGYFTSSQESIKQQRYEIFETQKDKKNNLFNLIFKTLNKMNHLEKNDDGKKDCAFFDVIIICIKNKKSKRGRKVLSQR